MDNFKSITRKIKINIKPKKQAIVAEPDKPNKPDKNVIKSIEAKAEAKVTKKSNLNKTLSIDVGIKNLCYCVIENPGHCNSRKFSILHWNLIDLVTDPHEDKKCTGILKSGKNKGTVCGNNASLFESGDLDKCYCSKHKPDIDNLVSIKTRLLCNCKLANGKRKGQECGKKASYYFQKKSFEKIGYCSIHSSKKDGLQRYFTVDNISDFDLKIKLFTELDKLKHILLDVDDILIEYQPPIAREKMKALASALHDYFIIRSQIDCKTPRVQIIRSVDAKHKLTIYDGPPISCLLKGQYDRNKWYSKQYCLWLLNKNNETNWIDYFEKFKKKDDLADSLLQGIWYVWYGKYNKKPECNKNHQVVVFREQNYQKFKKIRSVKPGKKQIEKCRISLSNIKYFWKNGKSLSKYKSSIEYYFGDTDSFEKLVNQLK